ncbi:2'-5' RNA ligase family protein [Glycomyces xiaoerkulensis]|uniref:2'-5' RNA ligase family protein n=1 Tax=Glycomyces xiaoerkulensis TaxID=2038139 RepID=UPI000C25B13C|nr:2'-5' RNA ligase family protein [Glycomyces xiaoerkulensis]
MDRSQPRSEGGTGDVTDTAGAHSVTVGVAIPVPQPWRDRLDKARIASGDPLGGAIPAHLTLLGPTEIGADALGALEAHLASVAGRTRPFQLHLRGTGSFRPVTDVVFVAVVDGIAVCEQLEAAIRGGPIEREQRFPYHPHVTVAQDVGQDSLDRTFRELAEFEAKFEVDSFTLYTHGTADNPIGTATPWTPRHVFAFNEK